MKAEESKIKAIFDMPPPIDVSGVKRLCGIVQYMAKFLPELSETMTTIRALSQNDNSKFQWSQECDKAFQRIKIS